MAEEVWMKEFGFISREGDSQEGGRKTVDWFMLRITGPDCDQKYLPLELRSLPRDLSTSFYCLLKTFFFAQAWAGSAE